MAAVTRRQYKGAAAPTTTTNSLSSVDTSVTLTATTGWPSTVAVPFYVVIDPGTSSEEKCSATISGSTLTLTRGQDDTTAVAHSSGATIYPVFSADDADEANNMAAMMTTKGDLLVTTGSAFNRLAVGSDGAVLMADSAQTNGVAWVGNGLSNRNVVINGAMQVTQRSAVGTAVTSITTNDYYTADRFMTTITTLGTWSQTTIADAPTGSGFRNSFKMACTTADASPAASDFLIIQHKIEGQNVQQFLKGTASAKSFALSFWVKSFQTGTFIAELEDIDNSRSVSQSYTVSVSNTWEKKTIIFPADTTGAFDNDNASSLVLNFWLGAGTTFTSGTLATTWGSRVSANRAVGVTNAASSTSNTWQVTGIQLEVGSVATPFEFEGIGTTLAKCQRYFYKITAANVYNFYSTGAAGSTTAGNQFIAMPVPLRGVAHTLLYNNVTISDYVVNITAGTLTLSSALSDVNTTALLHSAGAVYTINRPYILLANNTTDSFVSLSAELT